MAIDSHSTDCWAKKSLIVKLGLPAVEGTVNLTTMKENDHKIPALFVKDLLIGRLDGNKWTEIPSVITKLDESWPFKCDDVPNTSDFNTFSHLENVPFHKIDADVELLIGGNVPGLTRPLEVVSGGWNEPFATRYWLGWSLNGPVSRGDLTKRCNRTRVSDHEVMEKFERTFGRDFFIQKVQDSFERNYSVATLLVVRQPTETISHFVG